MYNKSIFNNLKRSSFWGFKKIGFVQMYLWCVLVQLMWKDLTMCGTFNVGLKSFRHRPLFNALPLGLFVCQLCNYGGAWYNIWEVIHDVGRD